MSKYTGNLSNIHNNVFVLTPLFVIFFEKLTSTPKNMLLSYLVLPLVLYKPSQDKIRNSNIRSSIYSFLNSKEKSKRENIYGLPKRIQEYKEITNLCIQYATDNRWIEIQHDLSIRILKKQKNKVSNLEGSFKAAEKLCNIFKDLNVVEIYRLLGVKKL